jgi:glycosyltransferase involved in cell wall biosynthesis
MRVAVATVQVPFVRGGAEILAEGLVGALRHAGHEAEVVAIPFKWYPPERILDHMLACRLLDLDESCGTCVDRVIGLKFPAYLIPHPNKVVWALHQHRGAYDLWSHPSLSDLIHFPNGVQIRDAIHQADRHLLRQSKAVYTISANVSRRLKDFCGIDGEPLYHPPQQAEHFYCARAEDYLFFPSRITRIKRQSLIVESLACTRRPVRVRFAGTFEEPGFEGALKALAQKLKVDRRVEWLGSITDDEKLRQYAHCLGVIYPPVDEDYGYVTLEAMLASKPLLTCTDSGGPLEFVRNGETGLVAEPNPESVAAALDQLWEDRDRSRRWGQAARAEYERRNIHWTTVVRRLTA